MNFDKPNFESKDTKREQLFEELFNQTRDKEPGATIELSGEHPKHEFLAWAVKHKDVLLHGSNNINIGEMEPRLANDSSKEFGNRNGVYAVEDPILPIFYSLKDEEKFQGVAQSGVTDIDENGTTRKGYHFAVTAQLLEQEPWSEGVVYLLPRDSFTQGTDDKGNLIDEWISETPVVPLAKIATTPSDFPYLDEVKPI